MSSTAASPRLEHAQRLDRERPVDAIDDEARRVAAADGVLPQRATSALARAATDGSVCRDDDLDEGHDRRRVEEVQPEDPLRPTRRAARSPSRTARSCWSRGSTSGEVAASSARKIVRLSVEVLERRLEDERRPRRRAPRAVTRVAKPGEPAVDPGVDASPSRSSFAARRARPSRTRSRPRSIAVVVDVVEDDLVAGLEGELGDPGAHRPGPDDADDPGPPDAGGTSDRLSSPRTAGGRPGSSGATGRRSGRTGCPGPRPPSRTAGSGRSARVLGGAIPAARRAARPCGVMRSEVHGTRERRTTSTGRPNPPAPRRPRPG